MQTLVFLVFLTSSNPHTEPMQSWNQCIAVRDSIVDGYGEAMQESLKYNVSMPFFGSKSIYCLNVNTKKRSYYGEN